MFKECFIPFFHKQQVIYCYFFMFAMIIFSLKRLQWLFYCLVLVKSPRDFLLPLWGFKMLVFTFFHVFTNFWLSLIPICRQITALLYTCMWSFPAESINVIWKFPSIDLRLHKKVLAQFLRGSWYIPLNDLWFVGSDICMTRSDLKA